MTLHQRLKNHIAAMAPHQKDREAGRLLIECSKALSAFKEFGLVWDEEKIMPASQPTLTLVGYMPPLDVTIGDPLTLPVTAKVGA